VVHESGAVIPGGDGVQRHRAVRKTWNTTFRTTNILTNMAAVIELDCVELGWTTTAGAFMLAWNAYSDSSSRAHNVQIAHANYLNDAYVKRIAGFELASLHMWRCNVRMVPNRQTPAMVILSYTTNVVTCVPRTCENAAITCSAPLCCQSVIQTRVASGHVTSSEVLFFRFFWNRWVGTLVGRHAYDLGTFLGKRAPHPGALPEIRNSSPKTGVVFASETGQSAGLIGSKGRCRLRLLRQLSDGSFSRAGHGPHGRRSE
jgi:hypothetical protein